MEQEYTAIIFFHQISLAEAENFLVRNESARVGRSSGGSSGVNLIKLFIRRWF
jgi:hypothetical protein